MTNNTENLGIQTEKTIFEPRHNPEDMAGQIWLKLGFNDRMGELFGPIEAIFEIHPWSLNMGDFQENWGRPKILQKC